MKPRNRAILQIAGSCCLAVAGVNLAIDYGIYFGYLPGHRLEEWFLPIYLPGFIGLVLFVSVQPVQEWEKEGYVPKPTRSPVETVPPES